MEHRWYAIQTTAGHENKVRSLIQRKIEQDPRAAEERLIRQALVPTQEVVEIKNGKKVTVDRKLYPGYVLVEMLWNQETSHIINGIQGVIKFVQHGLGGHTKEPMALEVLYRVGFQVDVAQKIYRFINDKEHQLPDGPLPEGQWQVFRVTDAKTRALSYSGSTISAYVPPAQKVELDLGIDPAIAVKQVHEWHGETNHHYDNSGRVDAFTTHDRYRFRLVNTKTISVSLEYLVNGNGDWTIDGLAGEKRDSATYRHQAKIDAEKVLELGPFTITTRTGEHVPGIKPPEIQPLPKILVGK